MARLLANSNHNNEFSNPDWVSVKKVTPLKIAENKWMLWACWGFTLLLPTTLALIIVF